MALVKDWIAGFLKRHKARYNPHDWPNGEDTEEAREYVRLWITAFATRQVAEAEADEASRQLSTAPPNFRREHLPLVVAQVETLRKSRGQSSTSTREAARDASRDCPSCGSEGLATVWSERPDPARRIPPTVAAYCRCPHGRWIKSAHADKSPDMLRRIPDLGLVAEGQVPGWLDHPPGRPELAVGFVPPARREEPPTSEPPFDRRKVAAMFKPAAY